ncbi:ribonuclease III [Flavobacterium agricola]|uniref:Ribonuclease 3 n=1 Tax=Flavobacterium agricola TaxID=2870839 RepID=A0ABY6M1X1_9FLAO|nr:ribonuclease III [Flavobacterium agricola]UYW00878.1 ribonuclease III [Flavobacterium agricola]
MNIFKKLFLNKSRTPEDGIFLKTITEIINDNPINLEIYKRAFTHRSMNKIDENGRAHNYERLEFLGDAMLGLIIAAHLFETVPTGDEGYLTKMRSKIVSRENLNALGKSLHLVDHVKSKVVASQFSENIHGNLFEALVGAIYLDLGYQRCKTFIQEKVIVPYVDIEKLEGKIISYKSLLIEWCQKQKKSFFYEVFEDTGNEAVKYFGVKLKIDNEIVARARATSKKKAEEIASKRAYFVLQDIIEPPSH